MDATAWKGVGASIAILIAIGASFRSLREEIRAKARDLRSATTFGRFVQPSVAVYPGRTSARRLLLLGSLVVDLIPPLHQQWQETCESRRLGFDHFAKSLHHLILTAHLDA